MVIIRSIYWLCGRSTGGFSGVKAIPITNDEDGADIRHGSNGRRAGGTGGADCGNNHVATRVRIPRSGANCRKLSYMPLPVAFIGDAAHTVSGEGCRSFIDWYTLPLPLPLPLSSCFTIVSVRARPSLPFPARIYYHSSQLLFLSPNLFYLFFSDMVYCTALYW